jgi:hypothetical protein
MKETIADFIARGGTINRLPAQERPIVANVLSVKTSMINIMDLDNGAHIYSETALEPKKKRGVKPKGGKTRASKINASLLPKNLLGLLRKIGVPSYEEKQEAASE